MDSRTRSIIFGAITIVVVAALIVGVVYFIRSSRERRASLEELSNNNLPGLEISVSPEVTTPSPRNIKPTITPRISVPPANSQTDSQNQTYIGQGFNLQYPVSWGLLTCSNSDNFEFDPLTNTDQPNFSCNRAVKPVTVLIKDSFSCSGETVRLGANQVIKSKTTNQKGTNYLWCVPVGTKTLEITHRVSLGGTYQGYGNVDASLEVEKMISTIAPTSTGS